MKKSFTCVDCFFINLRWVAIIVGISFPSILLAQDAQSKAYRASYMIIYKQTRLDLIGKTGNHKDTLFLQSESGEIDTKIQQIVESKNGILSNAGFGEGKESDKVFVNPYPVFDEATNEYIAPEAVYFYELKNRQSITMKFTHFTVKAVSVPLKVRFKRNDLEFSADANLGALAGYSWGKTKFTRREKIGNSELETMNTLGILFGTETLEFTFEDENQQTVEEKSALISTGFGFVHSYERFTVGLLGGFDFALGDNKKDWAYHARPWLGLAIGYSIFSF